MALTKKVEGTHPLGFLKSVANGDLWKDNIVVLSGQNLKACAVLGQVTKGTAAATAKAGNTGNGTVGAIAVGGGAKPGRYVLTIIEPVTNGGKFSLEDPDGIEMPSGAVGTAYSAGGLGFTLADDTDFASGDQLYIDVAAGSKKYVEHDPAGTDGREVAAAILLDDVDASAADAAGVAAVQDCEVVAADLLWKTGMTTNQKNAAIAALLTRNIKAR